jgi:hypothetical protein
MAETITDPDPAADSLGWFDDVWDQPGDDGPFKGEIGDLCAAGAWLDGYWVAQLWSNLQSKCVVSGLAPPPGGCPAGTVEENGFCVPGGPPSGCSSSGARAGLFASLLVLVALRLRRRMA